MIWMLEEIITNKYNRTNNGNHYNRYNGGDNNNRFNGNNYK